MMMMDGMMMMMIHGIWDTSVDYQNCASEQGRKLSIPILRHRISITGTMLTITPGIELVFAHLYKVRMMMLMLTLRR